MIPFGAIKYVVLSAVFVLCVLFGLRLVLAGYYTREVWRTHVKRHVYISQRWFRVITLVSGILLLIIAFGIGYNEVVRLLGK